MSDQSLRWVTQPLSRLIVGWRVPRLCFGTSGDHGDVHDARTGAQHGGSSCAQQEGFHRQLSASAGAAPGELFLSCVIDQ